MAHVRLSLPETIARHLDSSTHHPRIRQALSESVRVPVGQGYQRLIHCEIGTGVAIRASLYSDLLAVQNREMSAARNGFRTNALRRAIDGLDDLLEPYREQ